MSVFLLINGPNLNLLGSREPEVYGATRLQDIEARCGSVARELGHELSCYQSNAEHELIDRVQKAAVDGVDFIILNPGGFTHTSVALRDAFLAVQIPFIEIHLSNTFAREEFRHNSFFSDIAKSCLFGFGAYGYELALQAASHYVASVGD
ncbi:MAG: type II 3-dehydroquinate dehydratase [Gammaproteobacteria bacterium]|nr:type II 3-dehydroquinate dehydratase [Gammaproteobacteria bacterium]MBU2677344.1 type II 3-dehydroquinate dehydratase [Gammaproteobacteria bacterium]NNC57771.1 type II 3-dehydroquinate dehydratase [Woeseiaceae bacterium]NNL51075.1 type II 3-dehydroquinate dehydratase [Woeseiaceae bacterium]